MIRRFWYILPIVVFLMPVRSTAQDDPAPNSVEFFVSLQDHKASLLWTFYGQLSPFGFTVERKDGNNGDWTELGFVNDGLCVEGACSYQYTDYMLPIGIEGVYYRVKVHTNFEGGWYTRDVLLDLNSLLPQVVTLYQNFPNPVSSTSTFIRFRLPAPVDVTLQVFTSDGRLVETLVDEARPSGTYTEQLATSNLSAGIYFYRLTTPNAQVVKRIIVQR